MTISLDELERTAQEAWNALKADKEKPTAESSIRLSSANNEFVLLCDPQAILSIIAVVRASSALIGSYDAEHFDDLPIDMAAIRSALKALTTDT